MTTVENKDVDLPSAPPLNVVARWQVQRKTSIIWLDSASGVLTVQVNPNDPALLHDLARAVLAAERWASTKNTTGHRCAQTLHFRDRHRF